MNQYNKPHHYFERPLEIELIRSATRAALTPKQDQQLNKLLRTPADSKDAFIVKPASDFLETATGQSDAPMLFGDLWYEGELCILFADTNVGKSIMAVQIGDALSRGVVLPCFSSDIRARTVLYFDLELNDRQFAQRYTSKTHGKHQFADNFYRVVFNPDAVGEHKFSTHYEYISNALENMVITSGTKILIIDNITCLRTGTQAGATAVDLMQDLQKLKNKYGLSILVLAHTPKRNPSNPITRNDLQGSKMLINFADSAFAIGESQSRLNTRYLKQIKQRSGKQLYGADNVQLCQLVKPYNFLQFEFTDNGPETDHLLHITQQQRKSAEDRIMKLHRQGKSLRQISAETGRPLTTLRRFMKRLEED